MFSICPSFSVSRGRGVSRVAPLNELLLPPAVTVSIISILITVHGKNSPNLRNKGFARPSVHRRPRGPQPHPLAVFLLFSAKVWQSLMLHSSALTGGKDKETSVCDPSYSVSLPGSRYHSHLQNSPARSVQNVKLFKVIEIGKNYFATQPPFHLRCAEWAVLQEWRLGSVDIVPAKQVSR